MSTTRTCVYKPSPANRKKEDLTGVQLYPLINIQLYNPKGGKPYSCEGLLDSGADGLFIPKQLAEALELPNLEEIQTSGVLKTSECIKTKIGFKIGRTRARRIDFGIITATYPKEHSDIPILIGRDPLFKYFEVKFMEYDNKPKVKLTQKKDFD